MRRLSVTVLFLAFAAASASAQIGEIGLAFGGSNATNTGLGAAQVDPTVPGLVEASYDTGFRMDFRFTFNNPGFFGHEFGYAYNRGTADFFGQQFGMPIHQGGYNFLLYATPEGTRIRPFGTGGVHFSSYFPPGASVFAGNAITKFGFNYGGGIKVLVTDMFLFRIDAREYRSGKPDFNLPVGPEGLLRQFVITAGLSLHF